ncbi:MAG: putative lipoprotein [Gammaproteobacteria bacterium]
MQLPPSRFNQTASSLVIPALSLVLAGCSFSDSSGSLSDSVQSLSDSTSSIVSSPSSVSEDEEKYENEVADYTMAYVKSSHAQADYAGFYKGLSDIAAKRGISNWDQEALTYEGIGKGLKKAGVEGIAYETYKKNFANSNEGKILSIEKGYGRE